MLHPMWLLSLACADPKDPEVEPQLADLGEACTQSDDCESALCLGETNTCGGPCLDGPDCGTALCRATWSTEDEVAAACLHAQPGLGFGAACTDNNDCASYLCVSDRCSALCTDACGPDAVCEPAEPTFEGLPLDEFDACAVDLGKPDLALGPFVVTEAFEPVIEIEIPAGVKAFTIAAIDADTNAERWVGIRTLTAPDGTLLFDREGGGPNPAPNNYPGASTILVPSTDNPAYAVVPGAYGATLGVYVLDFKQDDPFVPIEEVIETVEVHFTNATPDHFDLEVFLAPELGLPAKDAPESTFIRDMLAEIEQVYAPLGLTIGELSYHDLPEGYASIDGSDTIRDICTLFSVPGPNRISINAFLVDSISFASGFTPSSPTAPGLYGTPASGIVFEPLSNGTDTGTLLAHELGHFFGLPHTTSMNLDGNTVTDPEWDAISDTPECQAGGSYQGCPDYDNLMFPFFPLTDLTLTPGQLTVLEGSAVLYPTF